MIMLSRDDLRSIVAEARLAPSVHNVQPSRWRQGDGTLELLGDTTRTIPVADPAGRDWYLSHGTALEGLDLALAQRGLGIAEAKRAAPASPSARLAPIASLTLKSVPGTPTRRLPVASRATWRGRFRPIDAETNDDLDRLASEEDDLRLVRGAAPIGEIARLADRAGLHYLREEEHRSELLHWLRLAKSHPLYERDGLNARAMHLNAVEAWGAGLVLGPLFRVLDRIGLAAPLVSDAAKTRAAAAIVLFHRPVGEDPVQSGRAFYRAWLAMENSNLKACPMSVLADWQPSRDHLAVRYEIPPDRHIVSVFRIGRPKGSPQVGHARLPVDELIV
jgi:nitroreductase